MKAYALGTWVRCSKLTRTGYLVSCIASSAFLATQEKPKANITHLLIQLGNIIMRLRLCLLESGMLLDLLLSRRHLTCDTFKVLNETCTEGTPKNKQLKGM